MKNNCIKPKYFEKFVCLKDACPNSCCKDWLINIDNETLKKYKNLEDKDFSEYLLKNITNTNCVRLNKNICPFLGDDCLCKIQKKYDEDYLSTTCKTFPRVVQKYKDIYRYDLFLSCPNTFNLIKKYHNQNTYLKNLLNLDLNQNVKEYLNAIKIFERKYKFNTSKKFKNINAFLLKQKKLPNKTPNKNLKNFDEIAKFYSKLESLLASLNFTNSEMNKVKNNNIFTHFQNLSKKQKFYLQKTYKNFCKKNKKQFYFISNHYLNYYTFKSLKSQNFLQNFYIAVILTFMFKMASFKFFLKEPQTFDKNFLLTISSFSRAIEHTNSIKQIKTKIKDLF